MKGLTHLLKPGEWRTYCRPKDVPTNLTCTTMPSKVTCVQCLSAMRWARGGKHFAVAHIPQRL